MVARAGHRIENCSAGPAIPPRLDSTDKLLTADREYQIAAAEFYAGQYEQAEADFDRIAKDDSSPWHEIADYLAARTCIREGTLGENENKLREAATRLRAIADDPARGPLRKSAEGLLNFVKARIDPEERLAELGNQIVQPRLGDQLGRAINDYTRIWDNIEMAGGQPQRGKSEVTDWIETFKYGGQTVEKWRAKSTLPWMLAALVWAEAEKAEPKDIQDLIAAAKAVKPDSPGYATAAYYGILRQIRSGQPEAARQWLDQALTRKDPEHVSNLLRAERFYLARNWTEFLRFAPRTPVASSETFDIRKEQRRPAFDDDAVQSLNTTVPMRLWVDATGNNLVPGNLQAGIAEAGWVRAVVLGDPATARLLAERLRQLKPELSAVMTAYLAEQDPAAANFNAVFLMLRAPGFEPQVRPGWGRSTPVLKSDELRDNWWALTTVRPFGPNLSGEQALLDLYPNRTFVRDGFLPADQKKAGAAEWAQIMQRAGNGVNYLCSETIAWANAHPQDSRVPEALHLAVQATHYGPADRLSTAWSKQAFTLLHSRYPKSEWAAKTKYWY